MDQAKRTVSSAVSSINKILGTIGVSLSVGYFASLVKASINAADAMNDLHLKTGLAFKDLAAFKLLADQSGSSVEGVATAVKFLSKYMVAHADELKTIGVTSKDVNTAMRQFADVIKDIQDPALRTALAVEVLGRSGSEMIPTLIGGAAAFDKAAERTQRYAKALEEAAPQADEFNNTMVELKLNSTVAWLHFTNALLPALNELAAAFNNSADEADGFKSAIEGMAQLVIESANQIGNFATLFSIAGQTLGAGAAQAMALAKGNVREAMAIGADWQNVVDKLLMGYDKVRVAAEKAKVSAGDKSIFRSAANDDKFMGGGNPALDAAARALINPDVGKALQKQKEDFDKFLADIQKATSTAQMNITDDERAKADMRIAIAMAEMAAKVDFAKLTEERKKAYVERFTAFSIAKTDEEMAKLAQNMEKSADAIEKRILRVGLGPAGNALADIKEAFDIKIYGTELEIKAKEKLIDATIRLAAAEAEFRNQQQANQDLSDSAQRLADVYGNVGAAIGGMTTSMVAFAQAQKNTFEEAVLAQVALANAQKNNNAEQIKQAQGLVAAAQNKSVYNQIKLYGDLASTAKGFFKEGTKGYKALEAAEKVYRVFQFAMAAKEAVIQALALLAPMKAAAANVASVPIVVAAEEAKSVAAGTTAAAIAAQSSPWTGLITMAAMIAALIAIGVKMSGSSAKGGDIAKQRQEAAGTGSVFGDASAKSQSIENSLKNLEKNSFTDLEYTNQMVDALRAIRNNIEGLVNLVLRQFNISGGIGNASGFGSKTTSPINYDPNNVMSLGMGGSGQNTFANQAASAGMWGLMATKVTQKLIDFGVVFLAQTLANIEAQGMLGNTYQDVATKTSKLLGLIKKTTVSENLGPLDAEFANQMTMIILGIRDGVLAAGKALGIFGNDLSNFVVDLGNISFKDMTGQQIQDQFNAIFSKLSDDMAKALFPAIVEFEKVGEGAFETLVRLARDYQIVDLVLKSIGQTFDQVGIDSIKARERLIELSGGIDDFISQAQAFAQTYMNAAERASPVLNAVLAELARLGISGVYTLDAFKNLVQSLDLTTEEGAALYAALMKLAPAFATAVNAVHDAVQSYFNLILEAQQFQFQMQQNIADLGAGGGGTGALVAMGNTLIEQYNNVTTTLKDKLAILNQLSGLVGQWVQQRMREIANERQAVTEASDAQLKILNEQLRLAQQWAGVLSSAKQMLDSMKFTTTNPLPTSGRLNLASIEVARLQQQLAVAAPEDRAGLSQKLLDALQKQLGLAQEFYQRPSPEYQAIYNDIIRQVTAIETEAQNNADEALRIQIEISALQEATVEQLKAIDAQIEAVNAQAIDWYQQIAAAGALVYEEMRKQAEADILDLADAAGQRDAIIAILTEINTKLGVPAPGFAEGLGYVPYDNFNARLHKGERVLTAQENRSYASGGNTITLSMPITIQGGSKSDADAIAAAVDKRVKQTLPYIKQQLKRA